LITRKQYFKCIFNPNRDNEKSSAKKTPEGTCSGDVVGGLSWTGVSLQALLFFIVAPLEAAG
jgi:hypothetical protein